MPARRDISTTCPEPMFRAGRPSFLTFIKERKPELRAELEREKKMTSKLESDLTSAIAEFKSKYFH